MEVVLPLIPYSDRLESFGGQCKRCGMSQVHVIQSIHGGMLCWDLGACVARYPLPEAKSWDPSMAVIA